MTHTPESKKPSWWHRNWKWVVPVGAVGLLTAIGVFVAGVLFIVSSAVRSSGAYSEALDMAASHPQVVEALGEPVKPRWFVTGSISVSGPSGEAELAIPLSGPKNKGKLYVIARKSAGIWEFERVEVEVTGRAGRIDVLDHGDDLDV